MREQLYALCSPDGAIYDEAVLGFAERTGMPHCGIALYTNEESLLTQRDLDAQRDIGALVRAVTYEEASEVLTRTGRVPPPRVAINGYIFHFREVFMKEVF